MFFMDIFFLAMFNKYLCLSSLQLITCPRLKDALIRLQQTNLQEELIASLKTNDLKNGYFEITVFDCISSCLVGISCKD